VANRIVEFILRLKDQASAPLDAVGEAAEDAGEKAKKSGSAFTGLGGNILALATPAAAAGTAIFALAQSLSDSRNQLTDWSTRTGVAADTLGGLRLAAKGSNLDFQSLAEPLIALGRNASQAAMGNADLAAKFSALGVAVTDSSGKLRSTDSVLKDLLASVGNIADPTERAAAANALLGEQGSRMLQALGNPASLDHFVEQARRFGVDMGPNAAKAAGDWQRAVAELQLVLEGAADSFFRSFGGSGAAGILRDFTAGFIFLGEVAGGVARAIIDAFRPLSGVLEGVLSGDVRQVAAGFKDFLGTSAVGNVLADMPSILDRASTAMSAYQKSAEATAQAVSGGGGTGSYVGAMTAATKATEALATAQEAFDPAERLRQLGFLSASAGPSSADFGFEAGDADRLFRDSLKGALTNTDTIGAAESLFSKAMEGLSGAASGALGGFNVAANAVLNPLSALSAAGPQGAAIAQALGALETIGRMGTDAIVQRLEDLGVNIIKGVAMLPELINRVLTELPYTLGQAVAEAIKNAMTLGGSDTSFGGKLEKLLNRFTMGGYGFVKGLAGGSAVGEGFAVGDAKYVNRTGLHLVHQGEQIRRSNGGQSSTAMHRMGSQGGGYGPPIIIQTAAVSPDVLGGLADSIGSSFDPGGYGRGTRPVYGG
jgi:hypothetical protein